MCGTRSLQIPLFYGTIEPTSDALLRIDSRFMRTVTNGTHNEIFAACQHVRRRRGRIHGAIERVRCMSLRAQYEAPSFTRDDNACTYIPCPSSDFPVGIERAHNHMSEIESGGAHGAHAEGHFTAGHTAVAIAHQALE